jgi:hypothetical protein
MVMSLVGMQFVRPAPGATLSKAEGWNRIKGGSEYEAVVAIGPLGLRPSGMPVW